MSRMNVSRVVQNVESLSSTYDNIVGDVLLSAGMVAYMGAFIMDYRQVRPDCSVGAKFHGENTCRWILPRVISVRPNTQFSQVSSVQATLLNFRS